MNRLSGWLRNAARATGFVAFQSVNSLRNNWGVAVLAVVLAISLWVFVTEREDEDRTGRITGTVPVECVNAPSGFTVSPACDESVSVRVRAPESILDDLTAQDFRATADLSSAAAPETIVAIEVESEDSRVEVLDFTPEEITVTLENVISRTVAVDVEALGGLPRGLRLSVIDLNIDEAEVSGPERLVRDVEVVRADVNLTGAQGSFEQRIALQARKSDGTPIEDVDIDPDSVVAQVQIDQVDFSTVFVVRPDVGGTPAAGYEVTGIQWDPVFVTVTGAADVVQSIDPVAGVETEAISIDGATTDVTRTVALRLPDGVTSDQTAITVTVTIVETDAQSRSPPAAARGR